MKYKYKVFVHHVCRHTAGMSLCVYVGEVRILGSCPIFQLGILTSTTVSLEVIFSEIGVQCIALHYSLNFEFAHTVAH